jgi:hypothetical protein
VVVSYTHRFVFLKVRKTAGTALELALSHHLHTGDILAPGGTTGEILRAQQHGAPPQNFATDPQLERDYHAALAAGDKTRVKALTKLNLATGGCSAHMAAAAVRAWVGDDFWQQATKITAERHPYEKALSFARFQFRGDPDTPEFAACLDEMVRRGKYPGYGIYSIDGAPVIDHVIRHETITQDTERVFTRLGLPHIRLPEIRRTSTHTIPASERLSPEHKRIIRQRCAPEFDLFAWEP